METHERQKKSTPNDMKAHEICRNATIASHIRDVIQDYKILAKEKNTDTAGKYKRSEVQPPNTSNIRQHNLLSFQFEMASNRPRGKTIHSEARNIIANVIEGLDIEKSTNELAIPLNKPNARAARYCGVSERTIFNIRKEVKNTDNGILSTPGKERPRSSPLFIRNVDSFDRQGILMASKVIKVALAQMSVGKSKVENVARAVKIIKEAKIKGSSVVVLPECFNSPYGTKYFKEYAEEVPQGPTCEALSTAAKENGLFVVGGSIPERAAGSVFNTCTVWNPQGKLVATFRKVHLFDIDIPGGITFRESDVLSAGNKLAIVDVGGCKIGIGICYDLRFQELAAIYRSKGVDLILYPGAFNMKTGPLHWELLLRARAVDNQVFVAGVCGSRDTKADYIAWGHTTMVDPWGKILCQAQDEETVLYVDVDLKSCEEIRQQIPISKQRRTDLYDITSKI